MKRTRSKRKAARRRKARWIARNTPKDSWWVRHLQLIDDGSQDLPFIQTAPSATHWLEKPVADAELVAKMKAMRDKIKFARLPDDYDPDRTLVYVNGEAISMREFTRRYEGGGE